MLEVSSEGGLGDVVGAVVLVDLSVLSINVRLRQRAKALQELRVKHQAVGLQDVLGQLQLRFGSNEAVRLEIREQRRKSPTL